MYCSATRRRAADDAGSAAPRAPTARGRRFADVAQRVEQRVARRWIGDSAGRTNANCALRSGFCDPLELLRRGSAASAGTPRTASSSASGCSPVSASVRPGHRLGRAATRARATPGSRASAPCRAARRTRPTSGSASRPRRDPSAAPARAAASTRSRSAAGEESPVSSAARSDSIRCTFSSSCSRGSAAIAASTNVARRDAGRRASSSHSVTQRAAAGQRDRGMSARWCEQLRAARRRRARNPP